MLDASSDGKWFAVQVAPRREGRVALVLEMKAYEVFLPRGRATAHETQGEGPPLFPGYLFCRFDHVVAPRLVCTPGVIRVVGIGRQPAAISEREIVAIKRIVDSGLPTLPWPYLELGQWIRVLKGPLAGIEGTLMQFRGTNRLVISIDLLERSVAVEISRGDILPLGPSTDAQCSSAQPRLIPQRRTSRFGKSPGAAASLGRAPGLAGTGAGCGESALPWIPRG
jgi:transcription antitermination factor NusG